MDEDARILLTAIHLNGDEPLSETARRTGIGERRVRYLMRGFKRDGLIKRWPVVNVSRLGLTDFGVYLDASFSAPKARERFVKRLSKDPMVTWVYHLVGEYCFGIGLCASDPSDVLEWFTGICSFPDINVRRRIFGTRIGYTLYRRRTLSDFRDDDLVSITNARAQPLVGVDDLSRKVLSGLTGEYGSRRELARRLKMPASTLDLRIAKLEEQGILLGEIHGMNATALGFLSYRILLRLRRSPVDIGARLEQFIRLNRGVLCIERYLGDWDFEFIFETKDPAEVSDAVDLLGKLFEQEIDQTSASQLIGYLKTSDYPLVFEEFPRPVGGVRKKS